ncbi:MAG TPA: hypothetical protein ENK70_04835, partial [Methylophaga sp.]|nr:hypothetical protein [Methylophaga sp.]
MYWFKRRSKGTASPVTYLEENSLDCDVLAQQIDNLVHYLHAQSIETGHTLALLSTSSWLINLMLYASSELGITLYPLDPRL